MMEDNDIQRVRWLADRYFSARTTPEEETELLALLRGSRNSLPGDMRQDALLLETLLDPVSSAPQDEECVRFCSDCIDLIAARSARRGRNLRLRITAWAAAAVAAVVIVVTAFVGQDPLPRISDGETMAVARTDSSSAEPHDTVLACAVVAEMTGAPKSNITDRRLPDTGRRVDRASETSVAGGMVEITDTAEACAAIEASLTMLAQQLDRGHDAVRQTADEIIRTKDIVDRCADL